MNSSVPIDDILTLWKRKRRHSNESTGESTEVEENKKKVNSNSKLKVHKIPENRKPKVALKSNLKDHKISENRKPKVALKSNTLESSKTVEDQKEKLNSKPKLENCDETDEDSVYEESMMLESSKIVEDEKEKLNSKPKLKVHKIPENRKPKLALKSNLENCDETDEDSVYEESMEDFSDESWSPDRKEEYSDESWSPDRKEDYSDESWSPDRKKNSYRSEEKKTKVKSPKIKSLNSMCSYEKMVEERRLEKIAFLQSLKICETKNDFKKLLEKQKKGHVKTDKEKFEPEQQSHKLPKKDIEEQGKAVSKTKKIIPFESLRKSKRLFQQIPSVENKVCVKSTLSFKECFAMDKDLYEEYVDCISIKESKQGNPLKYRKSIFKNLSLDSSNQFFLNGYTFTSLTWSTSAEPLVLVAGDKKGYIVIVEMNLSKCPYFFKPHVELVSNLRFNPYNPVQLFSTSFDCKFLCGDMVKQVFNEVYKTDATKLNYFDILSLNTFLIALKNGKVAVVDNRKSQRSRGIQLACHTNSVETVNVHPLNQNYFVTSENNGFIHLWDLRKIQQYPLSKVNLQKTWHSAFFSPETGSSILATTDCDVYSFDSTHLTGDLNLLQDKKFTEFHSCRARATWVSNSDEIFVIGSANRTNQKIEVYDKSMGLCHSIMHDKTISNCTFINAFHPYVPGFASTYSIKNKGCILGYL